jgi:2-methylcitrate dehydratase
MWPTTSLVEERRNKSTASTKEQADHSLPYVLAVAILDGQVMPEQYAPEPIQRADVQTLLSKVSVQPRKLFSERFPDEMPCRVKITLNDGRILEQETKDYEGSIHVRCRGRWPFRSSTRLPPQMQVQVNVTSIADAVAKLEQVSVRELMEQLARHSPGF